MQELKIRQFDSLDYNGTNQGVVLERAGKELEIYFGGNLDLYFSLQNFGYKANFFIGKDYFQIYELFDKLYQEIATRDIYRDLDKERIDDIIFEAELYDKDYHESVREELEFQEKKRESLKKSIGYQKLWHEGIIKVLSDDYPDKDAPYFIIKKLDDAYLLEFFRGDSEVSAFNENMISVRISNSGSRYEPFNVCFMRFYNDLRKVDPLYRQIHLEEYMLKLKK